MHFQSILYIFIAITSFTGFTVSSAPVRDGLSCFALDRRINMVSDYNDDFDIHLWELQGRMDHEREMLEDEGNSPELIVGILMNTFAIEIRRMIQWKGQIGREIEAIQNQLEEN
jgi:hypothetical protein